MLDAFTPSRRSVNGPHHRVSAPGGDIAVANHVPVIVHGSRCAAGSPQRAEVDEPTLARPHEGVIDGVARAAVADDFSLVVDGGRDAVTAEGSEVDGLALPRPQG